MSKILIVCREISDRVSSQAPQTPCNEASGSRSSPETNGRRDNTSIKPQGRVADAPADPCRGALFRPRSSVQTSLSGAYLSWASGGSAKSTVSQIGMFLTGQQPKTEPVQNLLPGCTDLCCVVSVSAACRPMQNTKRSRWISHRSEQRIIRTACRGLKIKDR